MNADSESVRRLLALYREGRIGEDELLARLGSERSAERASDPSPGEEHVSLAELLDSYRAAELSGAETVRAWADRTGDAELEGGLRVIAAREALHAVLLERRVRELGREPSASIPEWLERYNRELLDPSSSDRDRLAAIVARFPDVTAATAALIAQIDRIEDDALTRELLRLMAQDEELTLRRVHEAYARRR